MTEQSGSLTAAPLPNLGRHDLGTLLVCTVRYALGRKSYIVGDVCSLIRRYYPAVSASDQAIILANVDSHLGSQLYSDPADIRRQWESVAVWMRERAS